MVKAEDAQALANSANLSIRDQQITASVAKVPLWNNAGGICGMSCFKPINAQKNMKLSQRFGLFCMSVKSTNELGFLLDM